MELMERPNSDERTWAMIAHLGLVASFIIPIPFVGMLIPLIIWQVKKSESSFVTEHAIEALNFQITLFIGLILTALLMFLIIGFILLPALVVIGLIFTIQGAVAANRGDMYVYRYNWRIVS